MNNELWDFLDAELDRWQATGKVARFWLRDDDAIEPTPALARLLELTRRHRVPLALAVIPAHTGQALAKSLADAPWVRVCVHGWSHANHAGAGEKKQELGLQRPQATVLAELKDGLGLLQQLYPERLTAVLVPPWNRIAAPLIADLSDLGFQAISVFGPEEATSPLREINTHVDLMDWHGTRGAREEAALLADIVARLRRMHDAGGVLGLLTHHLVHDAPAWRFLDRLFGRMAAHPACGWVSLADMLDRR